MSDTLSNTTDEGGKPAGLTVTVNRFAVWLTERRLTGLQLKEAAIAQKAELQLDFQLWRIDGTGRRHQIGDEQSIEVHEGERFAANAPDDNS